MSLNFYLPAVLMEEATITTPMLLSEAVTESYQWTFMFQVNFTAQCGDDRIFNKSLNLKRTLHGQMYVDSLVVVTLWQ